ncbi:MAG: DUF1223 domain-containing protein [Alphaproteobacteria bacterium]
MMVGMRNLILTSAAAVLLGAVTVNMVSTAAVAEEAVAAKLTVVELFTSQSCYSCPPAEAFLGELVERDDLLALEWHVDYWDNLNYGSAGRWKDVFSDPAYTERQTVYNHNIRGQNRVFTPQMIIGGVAEAVGSRRDQVFSKLTEVGLRQDPGISVAAVQNSAGGLDIGLDGEATQAAEVWLIRFDIEHQTKVLRGENKGLFLSNHHVVRSFEKIGDWTGAAVRLSVADLGLDENQGCAILVQDAEQGPILGAALCPTGQSS